MEDSSSCSNCIDKEECIPESKSNLSLSVGCFPYENTIVCEDTTTCEDSTSEGSSTNFPHPVQGTQKAESVRNPMERQDEVQDNSKKFCKQTIALVLDADMGSDHEDSLTNWDLSGEKPKMKRPVWRQDHILDNPEKLCKLTITLIMDIHTGSDHEDPLADRDINRDSQRMDECPQENTELTLRKLEDVMQMLKTVVENQKDDKHFDTVLLQSPQERDFHMSSSIFPHMHQVSHQEHEDCQALPKWKPPENDGVNHFLEMPPRLEEDELIEMISQVTGTTEQPKEWDTPSHTETNVGSIFYWFRKLVVSSLRGRKQPGRATKSPSLLESKTRHFLRSKRIQPQESLESL